MRRLLASMIVGWEIALGLSMPVAAQAPAPTSEPPQTGVWASERIALRDGRVFQGLIESDDAAWVNLIQIEQPAGRPTYLVIRPIERVAIRAIERLPPAERTRLQQRIEQLRSRAEIEAGGMEAVALQAVLVEGLLHWRYQGKWFTLDSTVEEELTRRLTVRLEQIFTAYRQLLPPRTTPKRPLEIRVFGSLEEYRAGLKAYGLTLANPALFLREPNVVLAGTDVTRFAVEHAKIKAEHRGLQAELKQLQAQLPASLRNVAAQLRRQGYGDSDAKSVLIVEKRKVEDRIKQKDAEIKRVERQNEKLCEQITGQLLTRLYHEAFHAYRENYVFPRQDHRVPLWLDEGLAMIFEEALPESGTLRLGAPHRDALKHLKSDLAGRLPLTLEQVLTAGPTDFLVVPAATDENANRYYWYAWGLAYYLTFEKRLLADPALDRYLAPDLQPLAPTGAFEELVGMPLVRFETVWQRYIRTLR
ncbi:MAG: DUF1570 domain-containing protein [Thermoguttaceae bacterium]